MPSVNVCKTNREVDRDSKVIDSGGIGVDMIPNFAKNQRIGFSKGITSFTSTKKGDAFLKQNRGKDFKFEIPSIKGKRKRGKSKDFVFSL